MALFPTKTPDEIVVGLFMVLSGLFFKPIFEFSPPYIKYAAHVAIVGGIALTVFGVVKLVVNRGQKEKSE